MKRSEHELDVDSGYMEVLLPAADQCFADLDVYQTFYGTKKPIPEPDVDATHEEDEAIEISSKHYFDEDSLPFSVEEGYRGPSDARDSV